MNTDDEKKSVIFRRGQEVGWQMATEALQGRIEKVLGINAAFAEEITRLDRAEPVTGVLISYDYAKKLVDVLEKNHMKGHARRMQKLINTSPYAVQYDRVMEMIEELDAMKKPDSL